MLLKRTKVGKKYFCDCTHQCCCAGKKKFLSKACNTFTVLIFQTVSDVDSWDRALCLAKRACVTSNLDTDQEYDYGSPNTRACGRPSMEEFPDYTETESKYNIFSEMLLVNNTKLCRNQTTFFN